MPTSHACQAARIGLRRWQLTSGRSFLTIAPINPRVGRATAVGGGRGGAALQLQSVLQVAGLDVRLPTEDGIVHAVRGVDFEVAPKEVLAIVGESGSGKSVTSLAILGLLPRKAQVSGSARFRGRELVGLGDADLRHVRGRSIAMVFQDTMTSLNPVYRIGPQLEEALRAHDDSIGSADVERRSMELLDAVGISSPRRRLDQYPHELSGGMRQRVVIAIAMANRPDLIIADEPTTALDVTVQAQVLEVLKRAHVETGAAMVLITHDLGVVAGIADRVLVMYAGRAVEIGRVDDIFYRPRMPYTAGLLGSVPRLDAAAGARLTPIHGRPPPAINLPAGCPFHPRCPMRREVCVSTEPDLESVDSPQHLSACHFREQVDRSIFATTLSSDTREQRTPGEVVLSVKRLTKHFAIRSGGVIRRQIGETAAVDDVTFEVRRNETLGLVGESGSGKSTTGRMILQLLRPTSGSILFEGKELTRLSASRLRRLRRDIQIVFQDPYGSLDPRMSVRAILSEPLRVNRVAADAQSQRVAELLHIVDLDPVHANRYPHEFSGGQRQRIGIARALALDPKVLILDEPVSALDVSVRAGVINLLQDLRHRLGLSYLFIAHDLSLIRLIADRVAVMYLGAIVETAPTPALFALPAHPYTQALLSAVPNPDPVTERSRKRIILTGDAATPVVPVVGCRFRARCPKFNHELGEAERRRCIQERPALVDHGVGHEAACHYAEVVKVA
jgi:peptide/nickel transport system ATP-binding protein